MSRIVVLSEDRVFSRLLSRNLQKRGHEVTVHVVNARTLGDRKLVDSMSRDDLLILDLSWYDVSRQETYDRLADVTTRLHRPMILLVDGSWTDLWIGKLHAAVTLFKPFGMDQVIQAVDRYIGPPRLQTSLEASPDPDGDHPPHQDSGYVDRPV